MFVLAFICTVFLSCNVVILAVYLTYPQNPNGGPKLKDSEKQIPGYVLDSSRAPVINPF